MNGPVNINKLRERTSKGAVLLKNLIRRMSLGATSGGLWQLLGYETEAGSGVPFFGTLGIFARPRRGRGEAVAVKVGGAHGHEVIVATRDESVRIELEEDETAVFTSTLVIRLSKDGDITASTRGGVAVPLATKADLQELKSAIAGATTTANDGGAAFKAALVAALDEWPTGTQVFKAE
jgi:phage gp45-like